MRQNSDLNTGGVDPLVVMYDIIKRMGIYDREDLSTLVGRLGTNHFGDILVGMVAALDAEGQ